MPYDPMEEFKDDRHEKGQQSITEEDIEATEESQVVVPADDEQEGLGDAEASTTTKTKEELSDDDTTEQQGLHEHGIGQHPNADVNQTLDDVGDDQVDLNIDIPSDVAGWELVDVDLDDEDPTIEYWKKGSTHVQGDYESLTIFESRDKVYAKTKSYDKYGMTVDGQGGNTVYQGFSFERERNDRGEEYEKALEKAINYMEDYPANEELDEVPELPEQVGGWERTDRGMYESTWKNGDATLEIVKSGSVGNISGATGKYDLDYDDENDHIQIIANEIRPRVYRSAFRLMNAYPNGLDFDGEIHDELTNVKGIGDKKAKKLQLLGILGVDHLAEIVKNSEDYPSELTDKIDKILTEKIEQALRGSTRYKKDLSLQERKKAYPRSPDPQQEYKYRPAVPIPHDNETHESLKEEEEYSRRYEKETDESFKRGELPESEKKRLSGDVDEDQDDQDDQDDQETETTDSEEENSEIEPLEAEFGSKNLADNYRDEYEEYLDDSDDRRLKTVTLDPSVPDDVYTEISMAAVESRADTNKNSYGQAELTDREKNQIDFSENSIFHARTAKAIGQEHGVSNWLDYYDPTLTTEEHIEVMKNADAASRLDSDELDEEAVDEKAARAHQVKEAEECDHAEGYCRRGDQEACEFLEEECNYDEETIDMLLSEDLDFEMDEDADPELDDDEVPAEVYGVLKEAWTGYKIGISNAKKYSRIINEIRVEALDQEPMNFEEIEGDQSEQEVTASSSPYDPMSEFAD